MRTNYSKTVFLSLAIAVIPGLANAKPDVCFPPKKMGSHCVCPTKHLGSRWYIDAGLGWVLNQKIGTTYLPNINIGPEFSDKYDAPKVEQVPLGFLAGGYAWSRQTNWFPMTSLGIEYSYVPPARFTGILEEYSQPEDTYKYYYDISHHSLRLVGKADLFLWKQWMPYLSAGIGSTWNRFSTYNEVPLDNKRSKPNPHFANKTTLNFSYSLGAGVDYIFTKNVLGSLGYRYDYFGWENTGNSQGELFTGDALRDTSRAHTVVLSLRYLFA